MASVPTGHRVRPAAWEPARRPDRPTEANTARICRAPAARPSARRPRVSDDGHARSGEINFTVDFNAVSSDPSGSTAGLTVNSINFDVAGDILARYSSGTDNLVIGGSSMGILGTVNSTNDLVLAILAARSPGSANVASAVWVQNGQTFFPDNVI